MKNPIKIQLILLGIKPNDKEEYFNNPKNFENQLKQFPLQKKGENCFGIDMKRLKNYIEKNYQIKIEKEEGELIIMFYNYHIGYFMKIIDDFIQFDFDGQFFNNDENSPLIIQLKVKFYINFQKKQLEVYNQELNNFINECEKILHMYEDCKEKFIQYFQEKKSIKYDYGDKQIDIAILYSNPLYSNPIENKSVDYYDEITQFIKEIGAQKKKVQYLITQANKENLQKVLEYNPKIIHIISHGKMENYECYLEFENEGGIESFCKGNLIYLIQQKAQKLLVFFACCHAGEFANDIKAYATAIAIEKELRMSNKAGIQYFQSLYKNLLNNKTLNESHEQAKIDVKEKLIEENFQCCCNHSHLSVCQFKECFCKHCDCKSKQLDKILHLKDCQIIKELKKILQNEKQKDLNEKQQRELNEKQQIRLNQILQKQACKNEGFVRVCCCELSSQIINDNNDDDVKFEHIQSEKFKIFFQKEYQEKEKFLEDKIDGNLDEIVQTGWEKWDEKYFFAWQKHAKEIYILLDNNFKEGGDKKIVQLNSKNPEDFVVVFAEQVAKYFKNRKLKFYEYNKPKDIKIIKEQFENIFSNQKLKYSEQQLEKQVGYIFIIYKVPKIITEEIKIQLNTLNLLGGVFLISNQEELGPNFQKTQLQDKEYIENFTRFKKTCGDIIVKKDDKEVTIASQSIEDLKKMFDDN